MFRVSKLESMIELVEEQLVKGRLRWLANFSEIHKDYPVEDTIFPIYASGGLQEKGFFLSRIYSAMVVPRYKVHLLLYTEPEIDKYSLRKMIMALKRKFGAEDWIFLVLVQNQRLSNTLRENIENVGEKTVGINAYSISTRETVTSNNFLGRALSKQLRLDKYRKADTASPLPDRVLPKQLKLGQFEYQKFDIPNYLKSFTITFALGIGLLAFAGLSGIRQAISPLTILILFILAIIIGRVIYKSRYHISVQLDSKGFKMREGNKTTQRNWRDYASISIFVSSQLETFLRLKSKDETFDLPLSRTGLPRRETYNMVRQILEGS